MPKLVGSGPGYFTIENDINDVNDYQRGSARVRVLGDNVGLAEIGNDEFLALVNPTRYDEWLDPANVPYPDVATLITDLEANIFLDLSNAGDVPEAPIDGNAYVRQNAAWSLLNPEVAAFLQYENTSLAAPFSTSSATYVLVFTHNFNAEPTWRMRADLIWDYSVATISQRMQYDIRLNGVSLYELTQEAKDAAEVTVRSIFGTLGAGTPTPLLSGNNTLELYARKDNGTTPLEIDRGGAATMRIL